MKKIVLPEAENEIQRKGIGKSILELEDTSMSVKSGVSNDRKETLEEPNLCHYWRLSAVGCANNKEIQT